MLKGLFGDAYTSNASVFEWHKWFFEGRDEVEGNASLAQPVTGITEEIALRWKDFM